MEAIMDSHSPPASARWSPNAVNANPAWGPGRRVAIFDSSGGWANGATRKRDVEGQRNEEAAIVAMPTTRRIDGQAKRATADRRPAGRRSRCRSARVVAFSFGFIGFVLFSASAAAGADGALPPSESVESYWGVLPAPSDTVATPLADRPKALWEHAVLAPYRVATFPLHVLGRGAGAGVAYLDEHRVPDRVARLLGPRRGPFGILLDFQFGGLSGVGGGITAEHTRFFGPRHTLRAHAFTSTQKDHRLNLAARFEGDRGAFTEFGAGYRRRQNVRYFGTGPYARVEDESYFHQELGWIGATVRRPLGGASHLEANVEYSTVATGAPGSGHDPATETVFAAALPAGYGRHSYGASVAGEWMHESAGLENRPGRGGLERLRASYFESVDRDQVRFWAFRGEMQHFFTLWRPLRVLALRGLAGWIENVGDDPVPASRLYTNDDPDLLRGYDDFRWRDRGLAIATAEYRWPVWAHERAMGPGLDGYLLTDVGQVFGHEDEWGLRRLKLTYGGGLRLESGRGLALRLEYARSEETSIIRLRADQVFQFHKRGYLYGRDPIPAR
jgi:hypothetical protein